MSGDWIKMRTDLSRDPKVYIIADRLADPNGQFAQQIRRNALCDMCVTRNALRNVTVGALVTVWGIARQQGKRVGDDLLIPRLNSSFIDDISETPGLGDAMMSVGWVQQTDEGLLFPRFFAEFNVDPASDRRAKNAERQRRHREKSNALRDGDSHATCHADVTPKSNARERVRERDREESLEAHTDAGASASESGPGPDPEPWQTSANFVAQEFTTAIGQRVTVTPSRRKAISTRLKDPWWREHWQEGLEVASQSEFLLGVHGGWKITFDWFLKPDSLAKILDGNYSNGPKQTERTTGNSAAAREHRNASAFEQLQRARERAGISVPASGDNVGPVRANLTHAPLFNETDR